jgi:hypothetical protein
VYWLVGAGSASRGESGEGLPGFFVDRSKYIDCWCEYEARSHIDEAGSGMDGTTLSLTSG